MAEQQTCGRRMKEMGPWEYKEGLDEWEPGDVRWGTRDTDTFPEGFKKPRTCSFCGSLHPDDAIDLMEQGWEVETTNKQYKRYINPPGFHRFHKVLLDHIPKDKLAKDEGREQPEWPAFVHATPPAKLYVQHMDQAQCDRFNKALAAQHKKEDDDRSTEND